MDDVQISQCRLDHDDVRAFLNIEGNFAHRLVAVRGIHLIAAAVAELRRGFGGFAKWSIESRRKLRRVGHDWDLGESLFIQALANRPHPAIHHVAWRNHVRSGFGMTRRSPRQQFERGVIGNSRVGFAADDNAAMTVPHIFAEANVGYHDEPRQLFFEQTNRLLNDAVDCIRAGSSIILFLGDAKQ